MQFRRALVGGLAVLAATVALSSCSDGGSDTAGGGPEQDDSKIEIDGGYVALGDSYTAAPGVPTTETQSGCYRSDANYPSLIAAELDATSFDDVSCSGASTLSLVGAQQSGGAVLPAQFEALSDDTALVTISMGGNDFDLFQTLSTTCIAASQSAPDGSACRDQLTASGADPADTIGQIAGRVDAAIAGVKDRAPNAEVFVIGYPQPVPADGVGCEALPLSPADAEFVAGVITGLDEALEVAASENDATFIDVRAASEGHDVCAGDQAWVQGVQTDLTSAIALHPFAAEQRAVADLVLQQLES